MSTLTSGVAPQRASIARAAELLEFGMYAEALALVEGLPEDHRQAPAARRVLVRAATGTGRWNLALGLAKALRDGNNADRHEAAKAFQALAAEACNRGRDDDARRLVVVAVQTRLEQLDEILADERFPAKFRERLASRWK
jgi:lipopolysaccharide biosynthesis regulator YciM